VPHDRTFVPDIRPLLIDLDLGTGQGRQNRFPDGVQDFFRSQRMMVGRLMPVARAMPRCDTRSRCSFSTSFILIARSRARSTVTV
jgi:hypothetical protein